MEQQQVAGAASRISGALDGFAHRVDPYTRTRDKVAIVGFTVTREQALALGDDFEIWGLNELYRFMPAARFHRWFEVHDRDYLAETEDGKKHLADLAGLEIPVYMHSHWDDIPASVALPADELVAGHGIDYATNCPAWMLQMALAFGFQEIHVYGIDLANDTEYARERPCCEFWLGVAYGRGVKIHIPATSDLLKTVGRYGYASGDLFVRKCDERLGWLHSQDNGVLHTLRSLQRQYTQKHGLLLGRYERVRGALGECGLAAESSERDARVKALDAERVELEAALRALDDEYEEQRTRYTAERNQIVGALQDCTFWRTRWGVTGAMGSTGAMPDRTLDPRVGLAPSADGAQP